MRQKTLVSICALFALVSSALGVVDNLTIVVSGANATAGKAIGAFGYNPVTDEMYVASFGFTTPGSNATMRKITNVSSGTQVSTPYVSEAQTRLFYTDGDPNLSVSNPTQSGLVLNPLPIGSGPNQIPAFSIAMITDAELTRAQGSSTIVDSAKTKRVYSYNLQAVGAAGDPPPPYGDGRDVFSPRVSLLDMYTATGGTGTTSNSGRQGAWSGDGQSFYYLDSSSFSTQLGGVWKVGAQSGAPQRLLAEADLNTEPAVTTSGGVDKIYFRGGGSTGNQDGIDFITHDGSTTSARQVAVSAAAVKDFLEWSGTGTVSILAMSADADGNVYFANTTAGSASAPERRGLYKLDPQGRLAKVFSHAERTSLTGGTNSQVLREQARTTTFNGSEGAFNVTQILFSDSNTDGVLGAYVFKTGDFNRDNTVDLDDLALLAPQLTVRGVPKASVDDLKFDLNGNSAVDWKDVKILQQFYPGLYDGDANLDGMVDITDLAVLATNWQTGGRAWTGADFTGDDYVDISDLALLATNWQAGVPLAQALAEVGLGAVSVPEPAVMGLLALGLMGTRRRRG